eukprot:jgi/Bigna1/82418/fgenesh1_pg.92_\
MGRFGLEIIGLNGGNPLFEARRPSCRKWVRGQEAKMRSFYKPGQEAPKNEPPKNPFGVRECNTLHACIDSLCLELRSLYAPWLQDRIVRIHIRLVTSLIPKTHPHSFPPHKMLQRSQFQGFKKTGVLKKRLSQESAAPKSSAGQDAGRYRTKTFPGPRRGGAQKTADGTNIYPGIDERRIKGTGETKGSLACFMNKQLGVRTTGKSGLRKSKFESKEEQELYSNRNKDQTLQQYRATSKKQMKAAQNLGNIFMSGAKDKLTGKLLLPSSLKKKKKKNSNGSSN